MNSSAWFRFSMLRILLCRWTITSASWVSPKKWDWGTPPSFGSVARGKVEIFLSEGGQGQAGVWMSIFTEDVDALHVEYKKGGAIIRQPPTNMPWGERE